MVSISTSATVNAGTSTFYVGTNGQGTAVNFTGGNHTFYNVVRIAANMPLIFPDTNIFNNITISGYNSMTDYVSFGNPQTIGTLSVTSYSAAYRVLVCSSTQGTLQTVSATTVSSTNADWEDSQGTGASTWNLTL